MTNSFKSILRRPAVGGLAWMSLVLLTACGNASTGGSQVVASVGRDEITETQVNNALQRQQGIRPDQVAQASRKAVSNLVEQTIVMQKARDLKLDRDERVMQSIEATKREVIVGAYLDRIADGAGKPSDKDIHAYYDENPALFGQRKIYTFDDVVVDVAPAQHKEVQAQLSRLRSALEIGDYLKSHQIPARSTHQTQGAESLPMLLLKRVAILTPGQGLIVSNDQGLRVLLLDAIRDAPLSEEQARPAIVAYLTTQSRRQAVQKELASLQAGAKVAYFGKYADLAASAPATSASGVAAGVPVASAETASAAR